MSIGLVPQFPSTALVHTAQLLKLTAKTSNGNKSYVPSAP